MLKTKLTLEVEVATQFGAEQAWRLVCLLLDAPAISSIVLTGGITEHPESTPTSSETKFRNKHGILGPGAVT